MIIIHSLDTDTDWKDFRFPKDKLKILKDKLRFSRINFRFSRINQINEMS